MGFFADFHSGRAPEKVPYEPVNAQDEQLKAIGGNLDALGDIEELLSRSNTHSQTEVMRLLEMAVPGLSNLRGSLMSQAQDMADNPYELPDDVEQHLSRIAAERGVNVSGGRSQFGDFSALKDFGLNTLQYGQNRLGQASSLTAMLAATAPRVNPMSPAAFFIAPQDQISLTVDNNTKKQAIDQAHANAEAAAVNDMWATFHRYGQFATSMIMAGYTGGMAGGSGPSGDGRSGGVQNAYGAGYTNAMSSSFQPSNTWAGGSMNAGGGWGFVG